MLWGDVYCRVAHFLACEIMMCLAADIFEEIATETATLARYNKKPTVTSREIQTAGMLDASYSVGHVYVYLLRHCVARQDVCMCSSLMGIP